jgi:hypothetical protein
MKQFVPVAKALFTDCIVDFSWKPSQLLLTVFAEPVLLRVISALPNTNTDEILEMENAEGDEMSGNYDEFSLDNISQRVVDTYRRALTPFGTVTPCIKDVHTEVAESYRQLHRFFVALYDSMYDNPSQYGLPITPDDYLENHKKSSDRKKRLNRRLAQPRKRVAATVDLLRNLGLKGELEGEKLRISTSKYQTILDVAPRILRKCVSGLDGVGLVLQDRQNHMYIGNTQYPRMMAALIRLARAQESRKEERLRSLYFARCDFRSLRNDFCLEAQDLVTYYGPVEREHIARLDEFMSMMNYSAEVADNLIDLWEVKYQGPRKIKGTPLVQIEYDERYRNPQLVYVKCASTHRLAHSFADQPEYVRDDFRERVIDCNDCGWCEGKPVSPATLVDNGVQRKLCWYSHSDLGAINERNMKLVRGYVRWHQELA